MNEDLTSNIAFAGLTAAGKTTHARRLAVELGYAYVSATDILLDLLGIRDPSEQVWRTRLAEVHAAREDGSVDAELEERLVSLNREHKRTVFDTWALAWIGDDPLVRIWIESDPESRARKCQVSVGAARPSLPDCRALLSSKDTFNREVFRQRHGFDLFTDRDRYDAVLDNSHLIPHATVAAARVGIDAFAPVVHAAAISLMSSDRPAARALLRGNPREVQRLSV